jgi:hypothetical protein
VQLKDAQLECLKKDVPLRSNRSRSKLQSLKKKSNDSERSESSNTTPYGSIESRQAPSGSKESRQAKQVKMQSLAPIKNPPKYRKPITAVHRVIFNCPLLTEEGKENKYFRKLSRLLFDKTRYRLRFILTDPPRIDVEFRSTGKVVGSINWNTYFVWKDQYFTWRNACSWPRANTDEEELTWSRYIDVKERQQSLQSTQSSRTTGETVRSEPIFSGVSI